MSSPVVLITGASSGIGRCCAEHLAAKGYRVYGASRRPSPGDVISMPMDVRDEASVNACVHEIVSRERRLDVVVNNAGFGIAGAIETTPLDQAHAQFDVNFFGVLRVCRAVLPAMREQRSGLIVNIGSIAGLIAVPFQGLYSASKFALEGLTESLRLEVREYGIRVALIEPGDFKTSFTANRTLAAFDPVYGRRAQKAVSRMEQDEQSASDPIAIARLLERIIASPRPHLRYTAGPVPQRLAVWLKRLGPGSLLEAILMRYYS